MKLTQNDSEYSGKLRMKPYSPGDGYVYYFVFCRTEDIEKYDGPKNQFFISELFGKMKGLLVPRELLTQEMEANGEGYIRDNAEVSPECALVIWRFLHDQNDLLWNYPESAPDPEEDGVEPGNFFKHLSPKGEQQQPQSLGRPETKVQSVGPLSVPKANLDKIRREP